MWRFLLGLSVAAIVLFCADARPGGYEDNLSASPLAHILNRVRSSDYSTAEDIKELCSLMYAVELTGKMLRDVIANKVGPVHQTCAAFEPFEALTSRIPKSYMSSRRLLLKK